ncbi:MAG: hypothetical protein JWR21_1005 [Herminiimonas sp.]|nr:hypothetical protein [Herminiimonas sp.]
MVAAKVLVVSTTSVENDDHRGDYEDVSRSLLALRDRIERARLFNPTLKVLLALVDRTSPRADRQRDALKRLAHLIPSARVAHCSLANPGRLCALSHGRLDADMERDIAALCAEIFQDSNRPLPRAPQSLRSLRPSSGKAAETGRRSFINPAGRAGTPPRFR